VKELLEAPPRPKEVVDHWTELVGKRIRRSARIIGIGFIVTMVVAGMIIAGVADDLDVGTRIGVALLPVLIMGVLPAWAVSRMMCGDIKHVTRLVRDGVPHQASVLSHNYIQGTSSHVVLAWSEDGRACAGAFDVAGIDERIRDARVLVLAIVGKRQVAAMIGPQGIVIGTRKRV
jgi:hypothetical protein